VRAVPLIGRADQRVGAEHAQVERPVRGGGYGVDGDPRPGGVHGGDDRVELGHRAGRVRRRGHGDPARALREHGLDRGGGQRERVALGLGPAHRGAGALRRDHPRAHVGVVVEPRHDDLVAGRERAPDGGREAHRHRGHRRPEGDALRVGDQHPADRRAGLLDALVGRACGREGAAVVGAAAGAHPRGHRVDRAVDHLCAGRPVEARPAARRAREALAVHTRSCAMRTSSASRG
jgi:hypothetical protein